MEQSKEKTDSLSIGGTASGSYKGVDAAVNMNYAKTDQQENSKQSEESKLRYVSLCLESQSTQFGKNISEKKSR